MYNHKSIKFKIANKLNMIDWRNREFDFWKPLKDLYWNIGCWCFWKGYLNIYIEEGEQLPKYWFKYIRLHSVGYPYLSLNTPNEFPQLSASSRLQKYRYQQVNPSPIQPYSSNHISDCQACRRLTLRLLKFEALHPTPARKRPCAKQYISS